MNIPNNAIRIRGGYGSALGTTDLSLPKIVIEYA